MDYLLRARKSLIQRAAYGSRPRARSAARTAERRAGSRELVMGQVAPAWMAMARKAALRAVRSGKRI